MKPSDWLNLSYFLGMMALALSGKLIRPTEWRAMMGIEMVRSFTYIFASGMSVKILKKLMPTLNMMGAFAKYSMMLCGLKFLTLITLFLIDFAKASRPVVLIFQLVSFYGGLALYLRDSFKEAVELEAEEKRGGISFSFPGRPFARVFFALIALNTPEFFYALTFVLELILIRFRGFFKKA